MQGSTGGGYDCVPLAPGDDDEGWRRVAEDARNVFATPEWLLTWWKHYGGGRERLLAGCREDGRLVAVLPAYVWRGRPLRVARFLGHGPGDELGPACAPERRPATAFALAALLRRSRVDLLIGDEVGAGWSGLLGGRVLTREASPVLEFHGATWDDFLASRSRNFRDQARRRERKLAREHELAFRLVERPDDLGPALDSLFALHRARWEGAETSFGSADEAFHREFAALALDRGWLRLWLLELDGDVAAAWYGLRFAGAECYYQAGRDPRWEHASVGWVLLVHSIREAMGDGLAEYRFLRGAEEYKWRFTDDDSALETFGLARTVPGRGALAAATGISLVRRARRGRG